MKASIFFALICLFASVYGEDDYDNYDDEANLEATLACTAGTNVGDALMGALETCFGDRSSGRKKPFSTMMKNRDDDECYEFDDIMDWVKEEYGDDACVLQAIGWMDENYALMEENIGEDVMSLPEEVKAPIAEGHEDCTQAVLDYMEEATSHCEGFYSDEEVATLTDTATTIAKYECFLHLFEEGCKDFLGYEDEEE